MEKLKKTLDNKARMRSSSNTFSMRRGLKNRENAILKGKRISKFGKKGQKRCVISFGLLVVRNQNESGLNMTAAASSVLRQAAEGGMLTSPPPASRVTPQVPEPAG